MHTVPQDNDNVAQVRESGQSTEIWPKSECQTGPQFQPCPTVESRGFPNPCYRESESGCLQQLGQGKSPGDLACWSNQAHFTPVPPSPQYPLGFLARYC